MLKEVKSGKIRLCAIFNGDKNATTALYVAATFGWDIACLLHIQNNEQILVHEQAKAMNLPLIIEKSSGEELADIYEGIKKAKEQYQVTGIIAAGNYEVISKACKELGLRMFAPLWQKDPKKLLKEMIEYGMEIQINKVTAECLGEKWLGKIIDMPTYQELIKLEYTLGINPAGEAGEYTSQVLYCPHLFQKRIAITKAEKHMESDYTGTYVVQEVASV